MKAIKVYEDVHKAVKVEAARLGKTTPNIASELLRKAIELVKDGTITLSEKEPAGTR